MASAADLQSRPWCRSGSRSSPAPDTREPCSAPHRSLSPGCERHRSARSSVTTTAPSRLPGPGTPSYTLTCDPAGGTAAAGSTRSAPSLPPTRRRCSLRTQGRATCSPPAGRSGPDGHGDGRRRHAELWRRADVQLAASRTTLQVYAAATGGDAEALAQAAAALHCGEDPALLALPTPWADVNRCLDRRVRDARRGCRARARSSALAERAPELRLLHPSRLFPEQVGTQRCAIPAGGPRRKTLHGWCGVLCPQRRAR